MDEKSYRAMLDSVLEQRRSAERDLRNFRTDPDSLRGRGVDIMKQYIDLRCNAMALDYEYRYLELCRAIHRLNEGRLNNG